MKTGDIVYFINEDRAQLAIYKIEIIRITLNEYVNAKLKEIYFNNFTTSRNLKIGEYYDFPISLAFAEKDIHKYKLMKWIFAKFKAG